MSNLEHLIENSLMAMERYYGYDDWCEHIKDDPNWDNIWVSIEDLWTICQYVIYTWCVMRCEECKGSDCVECKHKNSYVCNDCKRMWIHKDDKFELNLNTDTSFMFEDCGYEGEGLVHFCHCTNCGAEIEYRISLDDDTCE